MKHLEIVVDPHGRGVSGVSGPSLVGHGRFGRERVVSALPLNKSGGPVPLVAPRLIRDPGLSTLADPDGIVVATAQIWVHRLLTARWTQDTRRLAV